MQTLRDSFFKLKKNHQNTCKTGAKSKNKPSQYSYTSADDLLSICINKRALGFVDSDTRCILTFDNFSVFHVNPFDIQTF